MSSLKLPTDWSKHLAGEFKKDYMLKLESFLDKEVAMGKEIYPKKDEIFSSLRLTPFDEVKVVIIGQDPYHGDGQAHGLSFSVKPGVKIPPSLKNIYKELKSDINLKTPEHGHLVNWASQGVLMLNAVLTVEKSKPASHQKMGWEIFTDKIIEILNDKKENLVFILWGNYAKKKGSKISREKHFVIESAHPSPFSVTKFYGTKPFSRTNAYLKEKNIKEISWEV